MTYCDQPTLQVPVDQKQKPYQCDWHVFCPGVKVPLNKGQKEQVGETLSV